MKRFKNILVGIDLGYESELVSHGGEHFSQGVVEPAATALGFAVSLAKNASIPIVVFAISEPDGLAKILKGEGRSTTVSND